MRVCSSNPVEQGLTPLMMIAEAPFVNLQDQELFAILERIMRAKPGVEMVDNHGNNALMLVCCNNHEVFMKFFCDNWAYLLYEGARGFRWNFMNW